MTRAHLAGACVLALGILTGWTAAAVPRDSESGPAAPGRDTPGPEMGRRGVPARAVLTRSAPEAPPPVPVLLVPGWFDTSRDLAALRIRFLGAGWPGDHVATLTFEDPTGSNRDHALELAAAITRLREDSGAEQIDIVAHSMGGLATRWYILRHDNQSVRRVAFIGSPHRGTLSAHLAFGGGRTEMMPDSPFLDTLNTAQPVPPGVEAITIRTRVDTHIVPGESATLPGIPDHPLCCPTHAGLMRNQDVFEIVLVFLEAP